MAVSPALSALASSLSPARTVLLFGAGASVSSGAPTAPEMCQFLQESLAGGERISESLSELASLLEKRQSRRAVVDAVVSRLRPLTPDGALVTLATFPWPSLYTTNYDRLIEQAYQRARRPLSVVRSNAEWTAGHEPGVPVLYKLHGCISQDRCLGHTASMLLTESDYDDFASFRQLLFQRLQNDLAGCSVVVIGQSLRDRHLQSLLADVVRLHRAAAAPGRIHLLIYDYDAERAAIWRDRGIYSTAEGSLADFARAIVDAHTPASASIPLQASAGSAISIPLQIAVSTVDLQNRSGVARPARLFSGAAADYADIDADLTFARAAERRDDLFQTLALVITGVAGTGKTTLARRLLLSRAKEGALCFEHRPECQLVPETWLAFEAALRDTPERAILLVDDCPAFQRQVNALIRRLPAEDSRLTLLVTADTSTWRLRQKDPRLYSHASAVLLQELTKDEIRDLRDLVMGRPAMRALVSEGFLALRGQAEQLYHLETRCSADMFVCLKALFSSETVDQIILREYAALGAPFSDVYRLTALLEAAGALPHRQMILRVGSFEPSLVSSALGVLDGLVFEEEAHAALGIYLWRTRHPEIARVLSAYKAADPSEFFSLLERVIESANPTYFCESRTLRELCSNERGIRALPDVRQRLALYRRIIEVLPADNVARHRLIGDLIRDENLVEAEAELRRAEAVLRFDPPLQRYRVRVELLRAKVATPLPEDQRAVMRRALDLASHGIERFPDDKYMYTTYADVAEQWYRLTGDVAVLSSAREKLERAHDELLDPELRDRLQRLPRIRGGGVSEGSGFGSPPPTA